VPLIINDRVDIASLVDAHGVHLGQTDMTVSSAKKMLADKCLIGVSCNTVEEVRQAVRDGADYIGIGPVFGTTTKRSTKPLVGVRGVGSLLEALDGTDVKAVVIGMACIALC
jgi:thiamine-phosphate diphosphorylase / hydroxyethylthiazole kinase